MEPNKEANKPRISYRYYELPEGELVQAITGEDWVCTYGTYAEDVHFHNVMEIGICRWGQGLMVLEDRRIQKLKPIIRSTAAYAPPEVVDGKPPVYPYTPIKSDFEDAGTVEEMMLYTELQSAVHAMIQRLEYSFTFNPSLLTSPKRKKQVAEILTEAEKYIWRIKEEMRCA